MPTSADGIAARLAALGTSTVHEALGRRGLMSGVSLRIGSSFAGPAETVAIPAGDNLGIHALLAKASAGSVLCVASAGRGKFGVFGDLLMEASRARGVAALVIDDGIRDLAELSAPPAIAARSISSRGTVKRRILGLDGPVAIGDVLVRPGDWIVGDVDGVCVVPARHLDALLGAAQARVDKEAGVRAALIAGRTSVDVLGLSSLMKEQSA
jgi:4-hydroxy-4-methyl-2-oxoglutarate aldolase